MPRPTLMGSGHHSGAPTGDFDFDGVDVSTNTEIFFLPSITLDNGIKIGANIQLEGARPGTATRSTRATSRSSGLVR